MEATPSPTHTLASRCAVSEHPATDDGALDGFIARCDTCGHSAAFSIRSMTEAWARDHVTLMTKWGK